jgi:hypothetical protein
MADEKPALNVYGDTLRSTSGTHGVDIASQRADELDLDALRFAMDRQLPAPVALDLGCGLGIQGMRLAMLGMEAHLYDLLDISDRVITFKTLFPSSSLQFHRTDLRGNVAHLLPARVGLSYSQRFVHYLPYEAACRLLDSLFASMVSGARLYLSASGLKSELGTGYTEKNRPLAERFGRLEATMGAKHQIHEDVCLYTEDDLRQLALTRGFQEISVWSSPFGNVKGIFAKP